jgi:hypothetical protein
MSGATEQRLRLFRAGYAPLPLNGKRPAMNKWETKIDSNEDEIRLWANSFQYSGNTGILTKPPRRSISTS